LIEGGTEQLDRTPTQPCDYDLARKIAAARVVAIEELFGKELRDIDLDAFTGEDADRNRVLLVVQALRHSCRDARGELTATTNAGVHTLADLRSDMELRGRIANLTEFGAFVDLGIGQDGLIHISQIPSHRLRDPHQMLRVGEVVQVWVAHVDQEKGKISLSMQPPRHVQEGRQPTLGEKMEQRPGRRERRPRRDEPATPLMSRAARAPESRKGRNRAAPLTPEGKPEKDRFPVEEGVPAEGGAPAAAAGPEGARGERRDDRGGRGRFGGGGGGFGGGDRRHGGRDDRGGRGRDDRGSRGQGGDPRVFTIESGREAAEQKGLRGELTSLAGLKSLLAKGSKPDDAKS
jgi:predicted RNA-binding protein with RPS1 domain